LKRKQLVAAPVRPRRLNPDISAEIEQLIRDLIQKDPLLRPTSVEYVIAVLKDSCKCEVSVSPRFCSVLVGRDEELESFRRIYQKQTDSSSTRFLALAGASGIGKTRLMEHFEIIARVNGAVTYNVNHHRGAGILEGFIQSSEQWNHQSDAVARGTKFRNKARSGRLKPDALAGSFVSHLKRVSESQAVVLCINDLQWMDEGSFEIYRRIASKKDLSLLIIGNYRTDEVPGYWEELKSILSHNEILTEFHLENLTRAEVSELATNILGNVPTKQLDRTVLFECAGNPFYVYESLRCLKEMGELSFNSGCWGWEPTIDASRIPATVVEGILIRFRRLNQLNMKILEYLSVLERPIRVYSLGLMEGIGFCGLDENLRHLERLDFVSLSGGLSQPFVSLSHDWLGRVIRDTVDRNRLQIIHKCVATILEELYIAENDPMLGATIVHHFLQAGDAVKTRKYIGGVVQWLGQAHFYKEATYLLRRAFKASVIHENNWSWFKKAVELFYLSGQLDECDKLCQQFLSRSARGSHARKAFVYSLLARIYLTNGRLGEALDLLEKALPIVEKLRDEELCVQVEGDLLCCLSRLGNLTRADTVANSILKRTSETQNKASREKLYHALCVYYELSGNRSEASRWETRAIRAALKQDKLVRCAGRINNLGILKLEMGEWEVGEKLCYSTLEFAEQIENRELALYAKGMLCLCQRKRGSHQEALNVLKELVQLNKSLNHNYHVEAELYIELAKNSNYQLFPERALAYLQESQKILDQHPVHASVVDTTLVRGWTYLLLANPVLAMRSVSKLKPEKIPREKGRLFLLLAQIELDLGNLKEAWHNARQAYDSFAEYMLYYRVRTLLIEGEILLMRGLVERSNQCIKEGLSIAKSQFYLPLMVRGWTLRGRCLLVSNNLSMARSCCLRALQVARQVGRPGLRVEACAVLGKIEAQLGNRDRATQRFTEALQILKERRLHLSPANRQSFTECFIEPIEAERDQFSSSLSEPVPRYFTQLRRFANLLSTKHDQIETGKEILKIVKKCLPGTSGNFLIRVRCTVLLQHDNCD